MEYKISDILKKKGGDVHTIGVDETVRRAVDLMNQHRIGALIVLDADKVHGIFTERDILTRVLADERDLDATLVRDVATTSLVYATSSNSLQDCMRLCTTKRCRHIPVIDEGKLIGVISEGDLMAAEIEWKSTQLSYLEDYIQYDPRNS
jgi:CBS domain-containing protein